MQMMLLKSWGLNYFPAQYYGRHHSLHVGPVLFFWGQMTAAEIEMWEAGRRTA